MPNTIIATQLAVDPALVMDANYKFNSLERRKVDDQILAIEQLIVDNLINGKHASWYTLSGASDPVIAGDTVCLASVSGLVTKTTGAALVNIGVVLGVVIQAASPGGKVLVAIGGVVPPSITDLTATSGFVIVDTSTSRCVRAGTVSNTDYVVGNSDNAGYLQVNPQLVAEGGNTSVYQGTNFKVTSIPGEFLSIGAVTDVVATYEIPDECTVRVDFTGSMKAVGVVAHAGSWDGKGTWYRTAGGAPVIVGAIEYGTAFKTDSGDDMVLQIVGNNIVVAATGADADNRNWSCEMRIQETNSL